MKLASATSTSSISTMIAKNQPCIRWIVTIITLSIIFQSYLAERVEAASIGSVSASSSHMLIENIFESNLENKCHVDQERKDLCERCIRFVFDRSAGYLGCCTNYDGIFNFCEKFLNYSFDNRESIMSDSSTGSGDTKHVFTK